MLTVDERAVLFYFCLNHAVARCLACARSFQLSELTADLLSGRTHLCPQCRRDLTDNVRSHLYGCAVLPAEVRQKAQTLREAARHLVKESRPLRAHLLLLRSRGGRLRSVRADLSRDRSRHRLPAGPDAPLSGLPRGPDREHPRSSLLLRHAARGGTTACAGGPRGRTKARQA